MHHGGEKVSVPCASLQKSISYNTTACHVLLAKEMSASQFVFAL